MAVSEKEVPRTRMGCTTEWRGTRTTSRKTRRRYGGDGDGFGDRASDEGDRNDDGDEYVLTHLS